MFNLIFNAVVHASMTAIIVAVFYSLYEEGLR